MSISFAGITFDRVSYDRDVDVLYLHLGEPTSAVDFDESPEGHHLRFDAGRKLVGITLLVRIRFVPSGLFHSFAGCHGPRTL